MCFPSGEILGVIFSGLPKRTSLGMRGGWDEWDFIDLPPG
jgi:hypothetical protein